MSTNFSLLPTVDITRSKFVRQPRLLTSFNLGQLIPLGKPREVLPGDTWKVDVAALIRMSTPIAPIMDNIYFDIFAFFVPNRLVWEDWKAFMGEAKGAGYDETIPSIPMVSIVGDNNVCDLGSIGDYMGLPEITTQGASADFASVSVIPIRGLIKIYNRWFRDQNLIATIPEYTGAYVDTNEYDNYHLRPFVAAKLSDYFTRALPYAQKGEPIALPIIKGDIELPVSAESPFAPVGIVDDRELFRSLGFRFNGVEGTGNVSSFDEDIVGFSAGVVSHTNGASGAYHTFNGVPSAMSLNKHYNKVADISSIGPYATLSKSDLAAATINQLRLAFAEQRFLEKQSLYGSRYAETLKAFFGVTSPDASLQEPQYLGGKRININIDQVLSTAGYAAGETTTVGQPGANSVTGEQGSLFTFSATEHGYIFLLGVARHTQTYGQGIARQWKRSNRFDFYFPTFANLGAQDVKNSEIYAQGKPTDNVNFGYQEAWAEYRYEPNLVTGLLNPSKANSLGFWNLANNFSELPTLGQTFIEQDRLAIARALTTGENGPDFIADFVFPETVVRPMPMYSIPGLIDHH